MNPNFQPNSQQTYCLAPANLNGNQHIGHSSYQQPPPPPPFGSYYQPSSELSLLQVNPNANRQLIDTASGDVQQYFDPQNVISNANNVHHNNNALFHNNTCGQHFHHQANHEENNTDPRRLSALTTASNNQDTRSLSAPKTAANKQDANHQPRPNIRQINCILKSLAKDRQPPAPVPLSQLAPTDESPPNAQPNDSALNLVPSTHNFEEREQIEDEQQDNERLPQLPEDVMEEIVAMELEQLREYESLHATSKRLPAYLKTELDEMYYEFERQLHIMAIRHQLHATLLYTHIGQTNRMRGATNYNNFCRFDPQAREIFSSKEQELKQRCKEVAKVWNEMDPDTKMKYKDPNYLETIRGNVPLTIVNGTIQTARQTHVSNTALNLASNKKSISFVRRWAKETTDRMNEIAACHSIQGFIVIASSRSSGDLFIQGGTRMGVAFMDMLVCSGDPFRKFHTYVAGLSVVEELTGKEAKILNVDPNKSKSKKKRKHAEIEPAGDSEPKKKKKIDKYCKGTLKEKKNAISQKLLNMLNSAGGKKFRAWPGTNGACKLEKAHIQVQINRENDEDDFQAHELFHPINSIDIDHSERVLRAIGENCIRLKYIGEDIGDGGNEEEGTSTRPGDGQPEVRCTQDREQKKRRPQDRQTKGRQPKGKKLKGRRNSKHSPVDLEVSLEEEEWTGESDDEDEGFDSSEHSDEE